MTILYNKQYKILLFIAVFCVLFFPSAFIFAEEKINSFEAQIKINSDSSILVSETIEYDFGETERHGIYREIPVVYKTEKGDRTINLEVQNITRDGQEEKYSVNYLGSNIKIQIGDAGILLSGKQDYFIEYKVSGAINYFENLDELYWNVTGNNWFIPIEKVKVTVVLPENVTIRSESSCYQGAFNSNEKCIVQIKNNILIAEATRNLQIGEGLTVAVDFPKGVVEKVAVNISNRTKGIISFSVMMFLIPSIITFFIMFLIWRKKGKDLKNSTAIISQYEPPKGMKPTLVGSVVDGRPDYRDITAGLIYLAEQGFLKIKRIEKTSIFGNIDYELELTKNDILALEKTEKNILNLFFSDNLVIGSVIKISNLESNESFARKAKAIIKDLYQEMADRGYFVKNTLKAKTPYIIVAILFIIFGMFGLIFLFFPGVIVIIFGLMMGKKTQLGADTKNYILGFKEFLSVTEKDRLDFHNAPEKKPGQFMEFLPYAIALGVEKKWAKQFEGMYIPEPTWYHSNVAGAFIAMDFVSHMSGFSESFSNNAMSGASGSGGGGFSGGGGGGGGGGSW